MTVRVDKAAADIVMAKSFRRHILVKPAHDTDRLSGGPRSRSISRPKKTLDVMY